jgi:serine phosphatase RsbU (regulator of sigma subunit)
MIEPQAVRAQIETLEADLECQKAQLRDLAMMGTIITSMHDIDAVLSVVMDMAIRLVDGEVGLIQMDEGGALVTKIAWGVDDQFVKMLRYKDDLDLPSYCFANRETVVLNDIDQTSQTGMTLQSIIATPIMTSGTCFGVLTIINKAGDGGFLERDIESLDMLLKFVAVAVDNSLLLKEKLKQQKMDQELAIAKQVQETILPPDVNAIAGVEIGAIYFPAREVGGDFYNVVPLSEHRFLVVIGDVSNKGVPAALVMSACSGIIDTLVTDDPSIGVGTLAESLNNILSRNVIRDREMFVTLFFCVFDLEQMQLQFCNAGHLPGLFWDESAGQIVELADGGPIIGQFPDITFKVGQRTIWRGDRLFLFTDGLTEAADVNNNLFGRERAEQVFSAERGLPPREFCLRVKEWVDRFQEGAPEDFQDDFTIMQIRVGTP